MISIILILSFLLGISISHIVNEESTVHLKIAATRAPLLKPKRDRRGPSPQGEGGNQSWLTTTQRVVIPHRLKRST